MKASNVDAVLADFDRARVYFDESGCVCRRPPWASIPVEDLNAEHDA